MTENNSDEGRMKPATALPWMRGITGVAGGAFWIGRDIGDAVVAKVGYGNRLPGADAQNADYIVHACNAYPKLVALVQEYAGEYGHGSFGDLLRELGESA